MKRYLSAMLALAGLLLFTFGAHGVAEAQGEDDPAQVEAGQAVYAGNCAGCHGDDGSGVAGVGRPLTGIASQGDRATHIASITDGKGTMPAFGERLSAEEIEQAASYVRLTFVEAAAEDAAEDAAAAEEEPAALAETGVGSTGIAIIGITMLAGGLQMLVWSRRTQL